MNTWRDTPLCARAERIAATVSSARSSDRITTSASYVPSGGLSAPAMWRRHGLSDALSGGVCAMIVLHRSVRVAHCEHRYGRARKDDDVQPERPVVDVFQIGLDATQQLFLGLGFTPPAANLGEAGQAGFHAMARWVVRRDLLEWLAAGAGAWRMRPRPDH